MSTFRDTRGGARRPLACLLVLLGTGALLAAALSGPAGAATPRSGAFRIAGSKPVTVLVTEGRGGART